MKKQISEQNKKILEQIALELELDTGTFIVYIKNGQFEKVRRNEDLR